MYLWKEKVLPCMACVQGWPSVVKSVKESKNSNSLILRYESHKVNCQNLANLVVIPRVTRVTSLDLNRE